MHVRVAKIDEFKDSKLYTLEPDVSKGTTSLVPFKAGQYISLSLAIGNSVLTRPYSLCSSPKEALSGCYKILVKNKQNGFASEYINSEFEEGTELTVSEPYGSLTYDPDNDGHNVVGIAGGSGIAPFISLANAIADGTEDFNLTILYGNRTEEDILFKDELDNLSEVTDGKITVIHVLSDEEKDGYENGFITAEIINKYAPVDYSVFASGSRGMYDFIEKETIDVIKVPSNRVKLDAYGEYKLGGRDKSFKDNYMDKTFGIDVVLNDGIIKTIPAKACETILTALERAGIKAPGKCRSGECGFCRSVLESGEVYVPSKVENRRQYDKVTGYIHPCCSFPMSDLRLLISTEATI